MSRRQEFERLTMKLIAPIVVLMVAGCVIGRPPPAIDMSLPPPTGLTLPASQVDIRLVGNESALIIRMEYNNLGAGPKGVKTFNISRVREHIIEWMARSKSGATGEYRACALEMRVRDASHLRDAYGFFRYGIQTTLEIDSSLICDSQQRFSMSQEVRAVSDSFATWGADEEYYYTQSLFRSFGTALNEFFDSYQGSTNLR